MAINRTVSGRSAEIRAYGFSGKSPYHCSSKYFMPCAVKIESGKIIKIIALELNSTIIKQKTNSNDAIEFLEAKKFFVVENNPINAKANNGKLTSGTRNTLSILVCQENSNASPDIILSKKLFTSNPFANSNSIMVSG